MDLPIIDTQQQTTSDIGIKFVKTKRYTNTKLFTELEMLKMLKQSN